MASANELKPLPHLPVLREEFISQAMMDDVTDYLVEEHSDLIDYLNEKLPCRAGDYFMAFSRAAWAVKDEVSKVMAVPDDPRGYIDFTFELSRRLHNARGMKGPEVTGKPIAPDIKGPYMPLASKEIWSETAKAGFTQEDVDRLLAVYYKEYPEIWYLTGEAFRRDQGFYNIPAPPHYTYFDELIKKETGKESSGRLRSAVNAESALRLRVMCDLQ